MKAKLKSNPLRIVISRYGNSLMLLMEFISDYDKSLLGKVKQLEYGFEIELPNLTKDKATIIKDYINNNL